MPWVDDEFSGQKNWVSNPFEYVGVATSDVEPPEVEFTPSAAATTIQDVTIYRGSGVPIKFVQDGTPVTIDAADYEGRIRTADNTTVLVFKVASGNMTDLGGGALSINPTAEQTRALSRSNPVFVELWRVGEDDAKTVVGKAKVKVLESITP